MTPRRLSIMLLAAALGTAIAVGVVMSTSDSDPITEALAEARDEDGFETGLEAGQTLARISRLLDAAVTDCDRDERPAQCAGLGTAAGYARVLAAHVLRCTAPGRFEARTNLAELLEDVAASGPHERLPAPAPLPDCG